ncbi:MAG: glycosyltransferase family 2 protein [Brevundimonas sp.]|uniref:glycosyltransferase family 2 protein n=1 Tax=Brevundimonas sp. TaxID=1871086 RepID=UPI00121D8DE0|nr:glycosyltransferase family A protein [Brevundimonas sp.]RZJ19486.1 MAG: glycosyltransferase family 2 protein [Brevundimonas sp.]
MSAAWIMESPAWATAAPRLSVLIPFLRDDPADLLARLETEAAGLKGAVEVVLLDDGTGDAGLTARLEGRLSHSALPVRLITLDGNEGRSIGRNRLASAARGDWLLFLDSDMRPDGADFLHAWLAQTHGATPVVFGGFSLDQAPDEARFAVHRALSGHAECVAAAERARQPEKYVYTSNLLVRRDVFETEAFDPGFTGWGWEDVEWAMRVSRRFPVGHIDNPATHMGLDEVAALTAKYEQSAPNFARVVARHPDIVAAYPSYRLARVLKRAPGLSLVRPMLKRAAATVWAPVRARALSLRLYRVALYADVV